MGKGGITVSFDWTILKDVGMGGLAIVALLMLNKIVTTVLEQRKEEGERVLTQWQASTDAINKNTEAFNNHSHVFERASERELEFQRSMEESQKIMLQKITEGVDTAEDTNRRVRDLQKHLKK